MAATSGDRIPLYQKFRREFKNAYLPSLGSSLVRVDGMHVLLLASDSVLDSCFFGTRALIVKLVTRIRSRYHMDIVVGIG